jgi:hypothetical protein
MVTLNGHFDGKRIIVDDPLPASLRSGTRLKIHVEPLDDGSATQSSSSRFQPLNIRIDPELANAIALDPEFNIEES